MAGWVGTAVCAQPTGRGCDCVLTARPQLSCYDQAKQLVLGTGYLSDGIFTHFVASFIAVSARWGALGSLTHAGPA